MASAAVPLAFVTPEWVAPQFTPALLLSVGLPFFLVTMASQNARVRHPAGIRLYRTGLRTDRRLRGVGTTAGAVWGLFHLHRGNHRRHMPEPGGAPDPNQRWLAAIAAGGFYLLAGLFGGSITALMSALPPAWIQMLAGLALLGTIGGSLFQAVHQASERDAAVLTFLVTASGVTLAGIGSAFWGVVLGGVSYGVLSALRRP